jgi:hypothetical protein
MRGVFWNIREHDLDFVGIQETKKGNVYYPFVE